MWYSHCRFYSLRNSFLNSYQRRVHVHFRRSSLQGVWDQLKVFTLNFLFPRKEFFSSNSFEGLMWKRNPYEELLFRLFNVKTTFEVRKATLELLYASSLNCFDFTKQSTACTKKNHVLWFLPITFKREVWFACWIPLRKAEYPTEVVRDKKVEVGKIFCSSWFSEMICAPCILFTVFSTVQ